MIRVPGQFLRTHSDLYGDQALPDRTAEDGLYVSELDGVGWF